MFVDALRTMWTLRLLRRAGNVHPLDAVAAVCAASSAFSSSTRFDAVVADDEKVVPIEPTEANLRAYVARDVAAAPYRLQLLLAGTGKDPPALWYHRDPLRSPREDLVDISVRKGTMAPGTLWRWLAIAASAYGAEIAWLETSGLSSFADERRRREAVATEREDLRAFLPPPGPLMLAHPALAERFARGVVVGGDRTAVPETVWWANVWSGPVVARVGRDRIEAAPWHRIEPVGDGLLLVACADPPDGDHPAALAAVADILDALQLPSVATPPNPEP